LRRILPLLLLLALVSGACAPPTLITVEANDAPVVVSTDEPVDETEQETINGVIAYNHIEALTEIGARVAGTEEETEAAQYIMDTLEAIGYSPERQYFTESDDYGDEVESANVIAVKDGDAPQEIIVGAHYDSAEDGLGADDNASGVAVMLEAAELVWDVDTPYTIIFVAFGAEEAGLLGSYAYVEGRDTRDAMAMINLDAVVAGDIAYIYSDEGEQAAIRDWALDWAKSNGFDLQTIRNVDLTDPEDGSGSSDYAAFQEAGIPFVYFEATNWSLGDQDGYTQVDPQYGWEGEIRHTEYDTLEYFEATFPGRVEQRLNLFVTVLYNILTQFEALE